MTRSAQRTRSIASPPAPHPKDFHSPLAGVTTNDGLRSSCSGQRPLKLPPEGADAYGDGVDLRHVEGEDSNLVSVHLAPPCNCATVTNLLRVAPELDPSSYDFALA